MKNRTLVQATLAILCLTLATLAAAPALAQADVIPVPAVDPAVTEPGPEDGVEDVVAELDRKGEKVCIQITVFAQNIETGECQEFPSRCEVPEGWTLYFDPATCTNW